MQTSIIASFVVLAATLTVPAEAQRIGRDRIVPPQIGVPQGAFNEGQVQQFQPQFSPRGSLPRRQQWGGQIGGRWVGGVQAPGGWKAYRRPGRGYRLPNYWFSPSFYIGNWSAYGLTAPPYGYRWSRYYDDAVLLDGDGRVYDSVSRVDWDGYDDSYGYDAYQEPPGSYSVNDGYGGYPQQSVDNGTQAGYGRDRHPPVGYGASYGAPGITYSAPRLAYPQGFTQTWTAGSGYYFPGGVTTTITVQQAPVVTTTTTTEYIERTVYRARAKRVWHKPVRRWKPKPRCCPCGC